MACQNLSCSRHDIAGKLHYHFAQNCNHTLISNTCNHKCLYMYTGVNEKNHWISNTIIHHIFSFELICNHGTVKRNGNYIHLFHVHKGDMNICSPEKSHISRGQRPREIWLFRGWTHFHISLLCKGNECFIPPVQRFGEFCQMKSFGHLCLQNHYFGTSLELYRYMTKALNLENFE